MKMNVHLMLAALRCYQKHLGLDPMIDEIATNDGEQPLPTDEEIDEICMALNTGEDLCATSRPLAFSETEMTEIFEITRVALANADLFDHIADKMDLSDDYMQALRDKVIAYTDVDDSPPAPVITENKATKYIVCEVICQRPSVTLWDTEDDAMRHAVACAMENLYVAEAHNKEAAARVETQVLFYDMLSEFDSIREGDYEVHILKPTNE